MLIAVSGVGTSKYDPREAIALFVSSKERIPHHVKLDVYKNDKFIKTFFRDRK